MERLGTWRYTRVQERRHGRVKRVKQAQRGMAGESERTRDERRETRRLRNGAGAEERLAAQRRPPAERPKPGRGIPPGVRRPLGLAFHADRAIRASSPDASSPSVRVYAGYGQHDM